MKILGVSHPIPPKYAKRIYNENKTVFVGKRCLCKVSKGDKFIIYESYGKKAYTGWANINEIGKIKTDSVIKKYGEYLIVTKEEFDEYSKGRKEMFVIEFENFQKFKNPVKPSRYVTVGGKYIYKNEFERIKRRKD